jgi:hypothetical protein
MTPQKNGPAMAATMNRPRNHVSKQQSTKPDDAAWQAPSLIRDQDLISDWREELTARIARETLIFEFADCSRREAFDALEAEVALFNRVCLAIAKTSLEGGSS